MRNKYTAQVKSQTKRRSKGQRPKHPNSNLQDIHINKRVKTEQGMSDESGKVSLVRQREWILKMVVVGYGYIYRYE